MTRFFQMTAIYFFFKSMGWCSTIEFDLAPGIGCYKELIKHFSVTVVVGAKNCAMRSQKMVQYIEYVRLLRTFFSHIFFNTDKGLNIATALSVLNLHTCNKM